MNKVFVSIGPITIYWYSVIILSAIIIGYEIAIYYCKKKKLPEIIITDLILGLIISAIIGARAYFVIFKFDSYKDNIMDIFKIWEGGLAIYGAIIGGFLYLVYYSKKKNFPLIKILDISSLSLLLGQAIGRWGNFFNSEAYGRITTLEHLKSLHIPKFIIDGMYIEASYREPTFFYESIWCLIGVIILLFIRKRKKQIDGQQISFYLIWYGIGRFFIERLRSDSLYLNDFKISQIVSIIIVIIGLIMQIIIYFKTHKRENKTIVTTNDGRI
ncbi:MAG: prolipoprotein diacylglyceryl transferase [Bacilli bacterium]|nr:prolipoprotein diacylglyceryl transferase [Bacilli bacterium]